MKKIESIFCICILIILSPILFISTVILIDSYTHPDEIPSFFGWKPFIVLTGSMETKINSGDIAIVKEVEIDTIKENDIIAFKENEMVITHRIIDIIEEENETRYITKGDNNNNVDDGYVLKNQIEGVYKYKIPELGNFAMFLQTPMGLIICLSIPVLLLIIAQKMDAKKEQEILEEKPQENEK